MKPAPLTVLTNAFYAFYALHRPAYHAYAAAHLPPEEAQIAVTHLFNLVADNWTTFVSERCPSAWAWQRHTRAVARRNGRTFAAVEDAHLLHDQLLLSIDQIATVTGTEPATVTALLAAARGPGQPGPHATPPAFAQPQSDQPPLLVRDPDTSAWTSAGVSSLVCGCRPTRTGSRLSSATGSSPSRRPIRSPGTHGYGRPRTRSRAVVRPRPYGGLKWSSPSEMTDIPKHLLRQGSGGGTALLMSP
ncbi:hypothetical protein ACFYY1_38585 [Streptomyces sp. NPDC001890]|uniref:hypothetical protein n=1 Tax=Streptomyces sp. NPDC001890 TaxID=3364620 RepID=UPI00368280EB